MLNCLVTAMKEQQTLVALLKDFNCWAVNALQTGGRL